MSVFPKGYADALFLEYPELKFAFVPKHIWRLDFEEYWEKSQLSIL